MAILVLAGLDPSGGAGIALDLRVLQAHGQLGLPIATTLTIQSSDELIAQEPVSADLVRAQLMTLAGDIEIHAVKVGALGSEAVAHAVASVLPRFVAPVVLDPVLAASRGGSLLTNPHALDNLYPLLTLLTPNLAEASELTGLEVFDVGGMEEAARHLRARGANAVLVKGGHLPGKAVDVLVDEEGTLRMEAERLHVNPRGTGCALSSAIAANLASKMPLRPAVLRAKEWLSRAIGASQPLGRGRFLCG